MSSARRFPAEAYPQVQRGSRYGAMRSRRCVRFARCLGRCHRNVLPIDSFARYGQETSTVESQIAQFSDRLHVLNGIANCDVFRVADAFPSAERGPNQKQFRTALVGPRPFGRKSVPNGRSVLINPHISLQFVHLFDASGFITDSGQVFSLRHLCGHARPLI